MRYGVRHEGDEELRGEFALPEAPLHAGLEEDLDKQVQHAKVIGVLHSRPLRQSMPPSPLAQMLLKASGLPGRGVHE